MTQLQFHDLQFALLRTPKQLLQIMKRPEWAGKIFVGGGFLRSIVAGDDINDIDVFVTDEDSATKLAAELVYASDTPEVNSKTLWRTDNAITVKCYKPYIQIIHRWTFKTGFDAADSFDFTCCAAMFWWGEHCIVSGEMGWQSYCDERFYCDVAAKRLIYRNPIRNEDAGGSMLRVLKYYQKGYRIPLDSLGAVMARMVAAINLSRAEMLDTEIVAPVLTGMLREVDPAIDPSHVAHLPAENTRGTPGERP